MTGWVFAADASAVPVPVDQRQELLADLVLVVGRYGGTTGLSRFEKGD
jgi:hypothetical protein